MIDDSVWPLFDLLHVKWVWNHLYILYTYIHLTFMLSCHMKQTVDITPINWRSHYVTLLPKSMPWYLDTWSKQWILPPLTEGHIMLHYYLNPCHGTLIPNVIIALRYLTNIAFIMSIHYYIVTSVCPIYIFNSITILATTHLPCLSFHIYNHSAYPISAR